MHDTAFKIGGLVIKNYCPNAEASILEIGSLDVNGSLRSHSTDGHHYIGIDYSAGEGVDFAIADGEPWPVDDAAFDLVIASSVFEHDAFFWETFSQMVRKTKPGGYIYINAPSNGWVHRYPLDCWRFYPDCGEALVRWSQRERCPVTLVESFVADRENDVWNDFCAVFRREPARIDMPERFVHSHVACVNVITWKAPEMVNVREQSEDMVLIDAEHAARTSVENENQRLTEDVLSAQCRLTAAEAEVARLSAIANAHRTETEQLQEHLAITKQALAKQEKEFTDLRGKYAKMQSELRSSAAIKIATEKQLHERFTELAALTHMLRKTEGESEINAAQNEWMRRATAALLSFPPWWQVLPKHWRQHRERRRLRRMGVFDSDAYLARYPDVAAARMDPFRHYIFHGMAERRSSGCGGA